MGFEVPEYLAMLFFQKYNEQYFIDFKKFSRDDPRSSQSFCLLA